VGQLEVSLQRALSRKACEAARSCCTLATVRLVPLLLTLAFLTLPITVSAQFAFGWDFRGQVPEGWQIQGVAGAQGAADGLHLKISPEGGGILRNVSFPSKPESAIIRVRSERNTNGYLLWHLKGAPEGSVPQLPFQLDASESFKEIQLPLSYYKKQWGANVETLGIFFDADSELVIESLSLHRYSLSEKAIEVVRGFWTFDEFRPYSINFLWGPLISYTPAMRAMLYETLPPYAHSATQWMYVLLGVCLGVWIVLRFWKSPAAVTVLGILCTVFAGLWIVFDVRMGSEIVAYALRDLNGYALAPQGQRMLRTHQGIFDTLDEAMPELQKHERFGLVTMENAFYSLIRYRSYPTLPMTPDMSQSGITLWLVGYRDDARIDAQNRLVVGEKILSGSGRIIRQFDSRSYLFSTAP
jgi:hypothetical protein